MVDARRPLRDHPRILVVEDEFFVAMDLAKILETQG